MTLIQAIILGIIQGITEFLPISSSGHLVLMPHLLGWKIPPQDAFAFDVLAQVATIVAVFVYFWQDICEITTAALHGIRQRKPFEDPQARLAWYINLATVPAGIAFLLFNGTFEKAFGNPKITSLFLLVTAILLLIAERVGKRNRDLENINWVDALVIGAFQILAIFPGISRSGVTITGGMMRDLDRPTAARFSFLIAVPLTLAAGLIGIIRLFQIPHFASLIPTYLAGFVAAGIVGYIAIRWLLLFLAHRPLYVFAIYCACFGLINLLIFRL
jgi:undecaprenyl-diphosphatase